MGRRPFYGTGRICDGYPLGSLKAQPRIECVFCLLLFSVAETQLQAREEAGEKGTKPVRVRFCFDRVMHWIDWNRGFQWEDAVFMEQAEFVTAVSPAVWKPSRELSACPVLCGRNTHVLKCQHQIITQASYRARYLYFGEFELKVHKGAPSLAVGGGRWTPGLGRPGLRPCEPTLSLRLRSAEREGFCFKRVMHWNACFQWEDAVFMEQAKFVTAVCRAVWRPSQNWVRVQPSPILCGRNKTSGQRRCWWEGNRTR